MKINSEGIYDSKPWKIHSHKNANGLDVRFTKKGNNLYVFIFNLPKNNTVFIPDLVGAKNSEAIAFGDVNQKLKMVKSNNAVEIKRSNTNIAKQLVQLFDSNNTTGL
jgi:hypothetical protein